MGVADSAHLCPSAVLGCYTHSSSPEIDNGLRVVHGSDGPAGRVGLGRVTILPDFGGSGGVGSALRIF